MAAAAVTRVFKRPGGLGDTSDEQPEPDLAAMPGSPGASSPAARAFKRPGGFGDTSDEQPDSGLAAMPGSSEKTSGASPVRFKRAGQLGDLVVEGEPELRKPAGAAAALTPIKSMARRQFGRGSTSHADVDEDFSERASAGCPSPSRPGTAEAEQRRRHELLFAGHGPQYGDALIDEVDEVESSAGTVVTVSGKSGHWSRQQAGVSSVRLKWGGGAGAPSSSKAKGPAKMEDVVAFSNVSYEK